MLRLESIKELCRYGTTLTVRMPSFILDDEFDVLGRYDTQKQALIELQQDEQLEVVVSDYGEETEVQITRI